MRRLASHITGVDQGSVVLFSDYQDGGAMWTGDGPREHRHAVRVRGGFENAPVVHIGLSMWDIDVESNQRVDVAADEVESGGFTIVFRTWGDTRVARVRADWLAIGPTAYEEDWEV